MNRKKVDPGGLADGLRRSAETIDELARIARVTEPESGVEHDSPPVEQHTHPVLPSTMSTAVPSVVAPIDASTIDRDGFTSTIRWDGRLADVVVLTCSSEKFRDQTREFIAALGFTNPHIIQVPGGVAMFHGLAVVRGIVAKAMELFLDKAIDLVHVREVVCIAHVNCGAYKAGRIALVGDLTRRLSGKSLIEVQQEHLIKAARDVQSRLGRDIKVRAFFASIDNSSNSARVHFHPIDFSGRSRS